VAQQQFSLLLLLGVVVAVEQVEVVEGNEDDQDSAAVEALLHSVLVPRLDPS